MALLMDMSVTLWEGWPVWAELPVQLRFELGRDDVAVEMGACNNDKGKGVAEELSDLLGNMVPKDRFMFLPHTPLD